jgi:hypothetical protein
MTLRRYEPSSSPQTRRPVEVQLDGPETPERNQLMEITVHAPTDIAGACGYLGGRCEIVHPVTEDVDAVLHSADVAYGAVTITYSYNPRDDYLEVVWIPDFSELTFSTDTIDEDGAKLDALIEGLKAARRTIDATVSGHFSERFARELRRPSWVTEHLQEVEN